MTQATQQSSDTSHSDGVNALDFSGDDLGAKINTAFDQGNLAVYVPNRAGLVISTTDQAPPRLDGEVLQPLPRAHRLQDQAASRCSR